MLLTVLIVVAALAALFLLGPRERVRPFAGYDGSALGDDPEAALARSEARFTDIRPGLEKEIIWRDPGAKTRTAWAVVYVHGFSAAKPEVRPLPDLVAEALDANLFYTRLTGHGRTGEAMSEAHANDWLADAAEAIKVGRRIGEKVLVIATSTGATASAFIALQEQESRDVAGLVFISPNFGVRASGSGILALPWARRFVPLLLGRERDFTAGDPVHDHAWTTRYPMVALLPMIALVHHVRALDFGKARIPLMVLHAPDDQTVKPSETRKVFDRWGGPKEWIDVTGTTDEGHHVIAGDIVEPAQTEPLAGRIIDWARQLAG